MMSYDRLTQGPAATYSYPELPLQGPYGTMYPQDQLSQIKMRNRRFMNACAMEMGQGMGMGMPMQQPMMMGMAPQQMMMGPMGPQPMMMGPPPMMDAEMATDELSILDQELNMTRRANRPFVPTGHQDYFSLQRQVQDMEQPTEIRARPSLQELTSVEQLPLPKKTVRSTAQEGGLKSNRPEVNIADQIAIRSLVLSKSLGKVGGKEQ